MKVSGFITSRCQECRKSGKSGFQACSHRGKLYIVEFRINGRRHRETVGPSKANAERRLTEIMSQVHDGSFFNPKCTATFAHLADRWLAEYAQPHVKPRTYSTYAGYINNRLKPNFGKLNIAEVS